MNLEQVTKMLGLMCAYWPSFTPVDGMAQMWAEALQGYDNREAWEALKQFRAEEDRNFAPNISNLIGRMDVFREIEKTKASNFLALEAPKVSNDEPLSELYAYKTSRTTPKRNKDDSDFETRKATRPTADRRKELEKQMMDAGYRKSKVPLVNGLVGFVWERI
jgi:hypothetical protein